MPQQLSMTQLLCHCPFPCTVCCCCLELIVFSAYLFSLLWSAVATCWAGKKCAVAIQPPFLLPACCCLAGWLWLFLNYIIAVNFATCFWLPTAVDVAVAATSLLLFQIFSCCQFAIEVAVTTCCTATVLACNAVPSPLSWYGLTIAAGWCFWNIFICSCVGNRFHYCQCHWSCYCYCHHC